MCFTYIGAETRNILQRPSKKLQFIGPFSLYNSSKEHKEGLFMKIHIWKKLYKEDPALSAEYRPLRRRLAQAGLSEKALRKMTPQQRVQTLEKANLDPYDFIFLAC